MIKYNYWSSENVHIMQFSKTVLSQKRNISNIVSDVYGMLSVIV